MRVLIEAVIAVLVGGSLGGIAIVRYRRKPGVRRNHQHEWGKWQVIGRRAIHIYGEVDEGRDLADRVDVQLERECTICGEVETKTKRGLDEERRG